MNLLLQPKKYQHLMKDAGSRAIMEKTVDFFEKLGKERVVSDFHAQIWYDHFIKFIGEEQIFAKLLTPKAYADGDKDCRWDTARNNEYSELLAFYGSCYWYCFQVTILGLGPIWMSTNEKAKKKAAKLLKEGAIFAFGLSEQAHGADIYSTEAALTPAGDGTWKANGEKYYIGNGNEARMISTMGKIKDGTDDYVFFATDSKQKEYECIKNVIAHQQFVANFALHDYPITEDDILSRGTYAWDCSLNTVNIGKFNIGPCSIGMAEHSFYEAITHASNRILYGKRVTDMPHVKQNFMEAWLRLVGMKLYQRRATDYFRSSSADDRRYMLYNPTSKMKVTLQSEDIINLLWDVIAARGFEKDCYFFTATKEVRGPSKLEGTVHVNVQLIRKFMMNYFFKPQNYAAIEPDFSDNDDLFVFNQGSTGGLGKVTFHDYQPIFKKFSALPNVDAFTQQIAFFKDLLANAAPDKQQDSDSSWSLPLGEMFSVVVYGQLILEQCEYSKIENDVINQMFDFMVRDFSKFALTIYGMPRTTDAQREYLKKIMHIRVNGDETQYLRVWEKYIAVLDGEYKMND